MWAFPGKWSYTAGRSKKLLLAIKARIVFERMALEHTSILECMASFITSQYLSSWFEYEIDFATCGLSAGCRNGN